MSFEAVGYMPPSCEASPPQGPSTDPIDRMDEALLDVVPESNRKPYDV